MEMYPLQEAAEEMAEMEDEEAMAALIMEMEETVDWEEALETAGQAEA